LLMIQCSMSGVDMAKPLVGVSALAEGFAKR
jgi:hypothetical protein